MTAVLYTVMYCLEYKGLMTDVLLCTPWNIKTIDICSVMYSVEYKIRLTYVLLCTLWNIKDE
jgi:hypothetical protein